MILDPLWGHQYIAETDDSLVFSIVQADLYVPAVTLGGLVAGRSQEHVPVAAFPIGKVPFWSELHAHSQLCGTHSPFAGSVTGGL